VNARERIATAARLDATRNAHAIGEARLACLPYAAGRLAYAATAPARERITSMCLGINDWSCEDCPGDFCPCACHTQEQPGPSGGSGSA
jgi:hypothetical protein